MSDEALGLQGHVHIVKHDRYGFIREVRDGPNLVVTDGKEETARLLLGSTFGANAFSHIAIGEDNTAPAAGQTALLDEITSQGGERDAATLTLATTSVSNDTAQYVTSYSFTDSFTVQESGLFNHSATGDMLCRQTFTALSVGNGDSLTVTWKIRVG
jgi:hypothetical protein